MVSQMGKGGVWCRGLKTIKLNIDSSFSPDSQGWLKVNGGRGKQDVKGASWYDRQPRCDVNDSWSGWEVEKLETIFLRLSYIAGRYTSGHFQPIDKCKEKNENLLKQVQWAGGAR